MVEPLSTAEVIALAEGDEVYNWEEGIREILDLEEAPVPQPQQPQQQEEEEEALVR